MNIYMCVCKQSHDSISKAINLLSGNNMPKPHNKEQYQVFSLYSCSTLSLSPLTWDSLHHFSSALPPSQPPLPPPPFSFVAHLPIPHLFHLLSFESESHYHLSCPHILTPNLHHGGFWPYNTYRKMLLSRYQIRAPSKPRNYHPSRSCFDSQTVYP